LTWDDRVDVIALVAERKILEAMAEGQFDSLPGAGRPLPPDELDSLPAESRMAARLARNAGLGAGRQDEGGVLPPSSEEGRLARRMARLRLGLEGRSRPSPGRGKSPNDREAAAPLEAEPPIMDSIYLEKILARIGG
jgi:hypothetical protein